MRLINFKTLKPGDVYAPAPGGKPSMSGHYMKLDFERTVIEDDGLGQDKILKNAVVVWTDDGNHLGLLVYYPPNEKVVKV